MQRIMWAPEMHFQGLMQTLVQDIRHAVRVLRKTPGFTISATIVLALGIGANTAIFSVVNAVLLRPLPFPASDRLVNVWHIPPQHSFPGMKIFSVSPANYLDWQAQNHVFDGMAMYATRRTNLTGGDRPESVLVTFADGTFFDVVGGKSQLGRTFTAQDDRSDSGHVAVLSHAFWKTHLGGTDAALRQTLTLNGEKYTIIGVMPARFTLPAWSATAADIWVPVAWNAEMRAERKNHNYSVVARVKQGVTREAANAELATISRRLEAQYPEANQGWGATAISLRDGLVQDVRPALLLLLGAVVFVLLIACANVANLVLARTLGRQKELAIRVALGASRARTLRHVLTETIVLSLAGGAAGLIVAHFGVQLILAFLADQIPRATEVGLDAPVLAFTLGVSLLTGVLAGVWPSWRSSRADLNEALKIGLGRTDAHAGRGLTRRILIIAEVALSLVLLTGAGLTIRSLWILRGINPGLDPQSVITAQIGIPKAVYPERAQQIRFYNDVAARVRAIPGVASAAFIDSLPLEGGGSMQPIAVGGRPAAVFAEQPEVAVRRVSTEYFSTMRIPVLRGRDFTEADTATTNGVVVISESLAKRFWRGEDPIGKRVTLSFVPDKPRQVIGIVGDVKDNGLDVLEPVPTMYEPHAQSGGRGMSLAARTTVTPTSITQAVIDAVHQVDRELPVTDIKTMDDLLAESLSQRRFTMLLLAAFAGLALSLAAVGIYSVLSYTMRRRVREISIRVAVGAQTGDVLRLVVLEALKPAVIGVALGLLGAEALAKVVTTHVYGVAPTDPATFAGTSLLIMTVALAASLIPAWRATRVDPIKALRED
jgi:predicted permease